MNLKNKIAIVTGSSRGFGAEIVRTFSKYGAKVVVTYISEDDKEKENAHKVAEKLNGELVLPLDLRKNYEKLKEEDEIKR